MTAISNTPQVQLAIGSMTHVGLVRQANEDSSAALLPPQCSVGMWRADDRVRWDGPPPGGRLRQQHRRQHGRIDTARVAGRRSYSRRVAESLHSAAVAANAKVFSESGTLERAGMGTTLTAAVVSGPVLALAHVGDSRAYLLRNGELALLTSDHTWVAYRVLKGALTPEEAETHPKRNVLLRALGVDESVEVDSAMVQIQKGDVILLSSDGMHGLVSGADIASVLGALSPQEAASKLIERANAAGGPDNVTAVVARVLSVDPDSTAPDAGETLTGSLGSGSSGIGPKLANAVRRLSHRG